MAQAVTTSVCHPTRKKLKACDDDDDDDDDDDGGGVLVLVLVLLLVVKELLNALYKYTESRPAKHILISCVLTLHVSIDIDQYQEPSTYPQTLDRMLLFGRFLGY